MNQEAQFSTLADIIIISYKTPGTAGGPGGRDRTLAVKSRKKAKTNE